MSRAVDWVWGWGQHPGEGGEGVTMHRSGLVRGSGRFLKIQVGKGVTEKSQL